jgi:dienelactone hydrolase
MIQIWYPVAPSAQGQIVRYRDKRITTLKDAHLSLVETHSILEAQVSLSQSRYPVLLYTPSWSGIRTESTVYIEELASHGYVVVAIDHPYSSRVMVFPDGRIVRRRFLGDEDYSSATAVETFVKAADQQVDTRAHDASFVLDNLERLNANDPQSFFTGRLDLSRVGIFGSSLGGGTAAQACWLDRRFKVGLDMGGMIAAESAQQGTSAPFLFMFEGMYEDPPYAPESDVSALVPSKRREVEFTREQFTQMKRSLSQSGGYWMAIRGIGHMNFFDSPLFSPLRSGPVDPERTARIIRRYALAFFDKHLKGTEQPLLNGPSPAIPEVRFEVWKARAPAA